MYQKQQQLFLILLVTDIGFFFFCFFKLFEIMLGSDISTVWKSIYLDFKSQLFYA